MNHLNLIIGLSGTSFGFMFLISGEFSVAIICFGLGALNLAFIGD